MDCSFVVIWVSRVLCIVIEAFNWVWYTVRSKSVLWILLIEYSAWIFTVHKNTWCRKANTLSFESEKNDHFLVKQFKMFRKSVRSENHVRDRLSRGKRTDDSSTDDLLWVVTVVQLGGVVGCDLPETFLKVY